MTLCNTLDAVITRLLADGPLAALVGTSITNYVEQDHLFPYIKVSLNNGTQRDTQTTNGFIETIQCDVWTRQKGSADAMDILDAVYVAMHNTPLTGVTGIESTCLYFRDRDFIEQQLPDLNHGVINFNHIYTRS